MKIANKIFTALGGVVTICGILNIWNPIFGHFQLIDFSVAYNNNNGVMISVVATALIAIGIGMIVKGTEEAYKW